MTRERLPGVRLLLARHPMVRPVAQPVVRESRRVVAIGQFKPTRDLDLLTGLGVELRARGYKTEIYGQGWPNIVGWDVESKYLEEQQINDILSGSGALILPYRNYYQSGVAIRAVENLCPVVGDANEFLADLMGSSYPGYVEVGGVEAWIKAVESVTRAPIDMISIAEDFLARVDDDWRDVLAFMRHDRPGSE